MKPKLFVEGKKINKIDKALARLRKKREDKCKKLKSEMKGGALLPIHSIKKEYE